MITYGSWGDWSEATRVLGKLFRLTRNAFIDLRYGGFVGGSMESGFRHLGANDVTNSDYGVLEQILEEPLEANDVLVDIGCGRGRVLNWWLYRGVSNRMIGIEIEPQVADETRRRLAGYQNVTVLSGDAIEQLPEDGTVFYLFNPFDEACVTRFRDRVRALARPVRIVYYSPEHAGVFSGPEWQVHLSPVQLPASGSFMERHQRVAYIRGPFLGGPF